MNEPRSYPVVGPGEIIIRDSSDTPKSTDSNPAADHACSPNALSGNSATLPSRRICAASQAAVTKTKKRSNDSDVVPKDAGSKSFQRQLKERHTQAASAGGKE